MSIRRNISLVTIVFVGVQIASPRHSDAWWPVAHYEITKNAGYPDIAPYAQLPDYVDSLATANWLGYPEFFFLADISHYFAWGHAAQKSGRTAKGLVTNLPVFPYEIIGSVPWKPVYPDDGRYPCMDMWYIIKDKLKGLTPQEKMEMERMIKGFIAHNAADRVVHFSFFSGAEEGDTAQQGFDKWYIHHQAKEKWADYLIYIREHFNDDWESAFEANGELKLVPEYANGVPVAVPTDAMARIMQLGQKVYEKNHRFTNFGKEYYTVQAQSIATIKSEIQKNINDSVTAQEMRSKYGREDFLKLDVLATEHGWQTSSVISAYIESQNEVSAWLGALGQ